MKKYKYYLKEGKLKSYNPLHQGYSEMYRKIINEIQQEKSLFKPKYNNNLSDTEALNKAYTNGKGYYLDNNKLYVAGTFGKSNITSNINDILSDIGLPLNLTRYSERYKDVSEVLENNPQIQHLIGHSLAGSVNAQLIKDNPDRDLTLTTYGAPFISMSNKNNDNYTSLRNFGDIVSILDRGSITSNRGGFNPLTNHQHSLFGDTGKDVSRSIEPVKEIL